jgi:putative ABC transport system permease protein
MTAARFVWIGLAAGVLGCFALAPLVNAGDVPKADGWPIAAIVILLAPPALVACYLPARRAVRMDSSVALRHE